MGQTYGGLARRASSILEVRGRQSGVLLLSAGDYSADPGIIQSYRSRFIAETMVSLEYDAVALGEREIERGIEAIREDAAMGLPLICGNLYKDGEPLLPQARVVRMAGKRITIFSLLGSTPRDLRGLEIRDPLSEGRRILKEIGKNTDYVILLAHMSRDTLAALMEKLDGVDLVIRGHAFTGDYGRSDCADSAAFFLERQAVPILFSGWGAQSVGIATIDPRERGTASLLDRRLVVLDQSVPEDNAMAARVSAFLSREAARRRQFELSRSLTRDRNTRRIVEHYLGMDICARCHAEMLPGFTLTRHFRAMEVLRNRGETSNPACLACHTTGYGRETGYSPLEEQKGAPYLQGVQCEACHGPGTLHDRGGSYRIAARKSCRTCHTSEWSPNFDYERYWLGIAHFRVSKDSLSMENR